MLEFICDTDNKKLSTVISLRYPTLGKGRIRSLIKNKEVTVDGVRTREDVYVNVGFLIRVYATLPEREYGVQTVYEDDNLFVFNKPKGLETQGEYSLESYAKTLCESSRAVHRLDMNTDGVIIVAKNERIEKALIKAIRENKISKHYLAVVYGKTEEKSELRAYLKKDAKNAKVKIFEKYVEGSLPILTKYRTLCCKDGYSVVDIDLVTGRTHQIRAQFAYIGHQVLGDGKYGRGDVNAKFPYKKQALTSYKISFDTEGELEYLKGKTFEIDCNIKHLLK